MLQGWFCLRPLKQPFKRPQVLFFRFRQVYIQLLQHSLFQAFFKSFCLFFYYHNHKKFWQTQSRVGLKSESEKFVNWQKLSSFLKSLLFFFVRIPPMTVQKCQIDLGIGKNWSGKKKLIRFDDFLCLMLTAKSLHNNFFTIKIGLQYSTFCRFFL